MQKRKLLGQWLIRAGWGITGVIVAGVYLYYLRAQSMPDLQFWHQQHLAESVVPEPKRFGELTLEDYLAHENQIFDQLEDAIADIDADVPGWHRYGATAHAIYRQAWPAGNRSVLQTPEQKRGAALLVHGLSDSTHSMRPLAESLFQSGYETLNLRMPGHGTLPAALLNTNWQQFTGAFQLGVRALSAELAPEQPIILVGYSNGAALAVNYTADALASDGALPVPQLLVLLSPAIRVSSLAAYARIQRWVSELPGMEKLGWTDVVAEFDPFKYNSFPVKAGEEIYQLTAQLQKKLRRLSPEQLENFPRVIAFQSVLDSTIPADSAVTGLIDHLTSTPAEIVFFDINRNSSLLPLLVDSGRPMLESISARQQLGFDLTIVSNTHEDSAQLSIRSRRQGASDWQEEATDMEWPRGVYSLSHVALPFDANDPVYGETASGSPTRLGDLWFRGEQGGLAIPLELLARQRFNPFFPYLEQKVLSAVESVTPTPEAAGS